MKRVENALRTHCGPTDPIAGERSAQTPTDHDVTAPSFKVRVKLTLAIPYMDGLTLFGLVAVVAMLIFYSLEGRSPVFILAFAVACWMGSVYGFLQGAWPFGMVEGIWGFVALRKWWQRIRSKDKQAESR